MASAEFAPLADALATDHTVVTYDPRGIAASSIDDPEQDSTPELRADDVAALLDALGAESADVFGSSGGAVTGLALVARHPGRVRTLVAHEPPLLELLPDAAEQRAKTEDIIETFHARACEAAWMQVHGQRRIRQGRAGRRAHARRAAGAVRAGAAQGRPLLRPRAAANDPVRARYRGADAARRGWWSASARTRATCSPTGPQSRWPSGSASSPSNSPAITADSWERQRNSPMSCERCWRPDVLPASERVCTATRRSA